MAMGSNSYSFPVLLKYKGAGIRAIFFLSCAIFSLTSCAMISCRSDSEWIGYTEYGTASFYAEKFQHKKTASGEFFNQYSLSAAHKRLPFGTRVKVTNVKSNKSVVVKINDRGPFVKGRIIDLTRHAFTRIGNARTGIINVKLEVVE